MSTLKQQALEEAVLAALDKKVEAALKTARATTQQTLEETDIEKQAVRLPDGTKVASIVGVNPEPAPEVTNEEKFLAWVAEHAPTEVEEETVTIRRVRPAYRDALLEALAKRKTTEAVLDGGELVKVAGVEMKEKTRSHQVRFEGGDAGRDLVAAAWASGQLADQLPNLLALTAGGTE